MYKTRKNEYLLKNIIFYEFFMNIYELSQIAL